MALIKSLTLLLAFLAGASAKKISEGQETTKLQSTKLARAALPAPTYKHGRALECRGAPWCGDGCWEDACEDAYNTHCTNVDDDCQWKCGVGESFWGTYNLTCVDTGFEECDWFCGNATEVSGAARATMRLSLIVTLALIVMAIY